MKDVTFPCKPHVPVLPGVTVLLQCWGVWEHRSTRLQSLFGDKALKKFGDSQIDTIRVLLLFTDQNSLQYCKLIELSFKAVGFILMQCTDFEN